MDWSVENMEWWNIFYQAPRFITLSFITPLQSIPDFIECHFYYGVDHNGVTDLLFPNYLWLFFSYFLFVLRDWLKIRKRIWR